MPKARSKPANAAPSATRARKKTAIRGNVARVYRDAILESAERVFGRVGFFDAKMAEIAREAGLAAGTLYNYFESKEQIFQSLLEYRGVELLERAQANLDTAEDSRQLLRALVRSSAAYVEAHGVMFQLFVELGVHASWGMGRVCGEGAEARYFRYLGLYEEAVRRCVADGWLRADVPTRDLVTMLMGGINGLIHEWLHGGGQGPLTARTEAVLDLFLQGALAR